MIYVLCDAADLSALWAARALRARGRVTEVVTAAMLDCAPRWHHAIADDGRTHVSVTLGDGRCLASDRPAGVLNRLLYAPCARVRRVGGDDGDYAAQELSALFLSFLMALPGPMANRPTPEGLCGRLRHPSAWALLAAQAGLDAAPYRQSHASDPSEAWRPCEAQDKTSVFVVSDRVVAPAHVPAPVLLSCRRLARASEEMLLGIDVTVSPDGRWRFVGASPAPDLRAGGDELVDVLAEVLTPPVLSDRRAS
ncbi:MAG: hypothetical protein ABW252_04350 [Polyangiales bacterium]